MKGVRNSKKSKKPKKGIRYIAQKLRKYYPKRYTSFNDALVKARTIKSTLDSRSETTDKKIILKNIFSVERIPRPPKDNEPIIPADKFYTAFDYFDAIDVSDLIKLQLPSNVYVESRISPTDLPMLQGMTDNDAKFKAETGNDLSKEYFSKFINWGNELQILSLNKYPMFFVFTKPIRKNNKWVMFIVSCDEGGIRCDYGFDPDKDGKPSEIYTCADEYEDMPYNSLRAEAKKRGIKTKNPKKKDLVELLRQYDKNNAPQPKEIAKKESTKGTESIKLEKELEVEKQKTADSQSELIRQQNIKDINTLFLRGDLTKIEWKEAIAELRKK